MHSKLPYTPFKSVTHFGCVLVGSNCRIAAYPAREIHEPHEILPEGISSMATPSYDLSRTPDLPDLDFELVHSRMAVKPKKLQAFTRFDYGFMQKHQNLSPCVEKHAASPGRALELVHKMATQASPSHQTCTVSLRFAKRRSATVASSGPAEEELRIGTRPHSRANRLKTRCSSTSQPNASSTQSTS
jgi:hypothetical protein